MHEPDAILDFWFGDHAKARWFAKEPAFDAEIRRRFAGDLAAAKAGRLAGWEAAAESCLALVILLDQFSRNIHRDRPEAFAADAQARDVADRAIGRGLDRALPHGRRFFFYLPFEHSEDRADQARAVALFRQWAAEQTGPARQRAQEQLDYVLRHQEIIERFGRFPHRNAALGRPTTPAEAAFLTEPNSAF